MADLCICLCAGQTPAGKCLPLPENSRSFVAGKLLWLAGGPKFNLPKIVKWSQTSGADKHTQILTHTHTRQLSLYLCFVNL